VAVLESATVNYWWLSFADGARPVGTQFLGCAIVPADDFITAVMATHAGGYNPGGEVQGAPYVTDCPGVEVPAEYVGRLLTKEEAIAVDQKMGELYPRERRDRDE
jgi:hypothetical protein